MPSQKTLFTRRFINYYVRWLSSREKAKTTRDLGRGWKLCNFPFSLLKLFFLFSKNHKRELHDGNFSFFLSFRVFQVGKLNFPQIMSNPKRLLFDENLIGECHTFYGNSGEIHLWFIHSRRLIKFHCLSQSARRFIIKHQIRRNLLHQIKTVFDDENGGK